MSALYFVLWMIMIVDGSAVWERFDFYFDTQAQCQAVAEVIPGAVVTACLTDHEDAIMRESAPLPKEN